MNRFWRLIVDFDIGDSRFIVGSEDVIRGCYDDIRASLESVTPEKVLTVQGLSDTVDRATMEFTFLVEHIRNVGIVEL